MLSGPQKGDYFSDGHHLRGGPPTPNESGLRSGLTPGGGGTMFPEPSPNSQALFGQLASGGATPTTLDFHRTAMSVVAAQKKESQSQQQNITSQPQDPMHSRTALHSRPGPSKPAIPVAPEQQPASSPWVRQQETVRKTSNIMSLINDEPSDSRPTIPRRFNDSVSSLHQPRTPTNTYSGDVDFQLFPPNQGDKILPSALCGEAQDALDMYTAQTTSEFSTPGWPGRQDTWQTGDMSSNMSQDQRKDGVPGAFTDVSNKDIMDNNATSKLGIMPIEPDLANDIRAELEKEDLKYPPEAGKLSLVDMFEQDMDPATIEGLRRMAEAAIKCALEKGHKIGGIASLKRILQEWAQTSGLPIDFFETFPERDISEIAIKIMESLRAGDAPATGITTPP